MYKPTPKSLLASSYSYSPPVKKPKLEYVPKSKSNFTSIATYVPSTSIKSNSDNESEVQKCGWDYLSEIIDKEPPANADKTPTYVPTKISRSTSEDATKSSETVTKSTDDENENKCLTDDTKRKSSSKPEKTKSRHDHHKSSSKSTSRSHSHSSKNKHENLSKTSSERSKSSKSTHRSSHEKSKSNSSRSDSKSSLDRNGSESKRCDKTQSSKDTKSSRSSSKTTAKKDDEMVSSKKTKPGRTSSATTKNEIVENVPLYSDNNISPSSVFDTDSEEDDVMAQCRMIFDEFKEVSNNGKTNDVVVSVTLTSTSGWEIYDTKPIYFMEVIIIDTIFRII